MPEGNLVGSSGKAQKGSYGKPKPPPKPNKKVKVKTKPPKGPTFAVVASTPAELKAASKAKVAPKQKKPKNPYGQWGNKATWDLFHKPQESLYDEHGRFRHDYHPTAADLGEMTPAQSRAEYQAELRDIRMYRSRMLRIWEKKNAAMLAGLSDREREDVLRTRAHAGIDPGGLWGKIQKTAEQGMELGAGMVQAGDMLGRDLGYDVKNIATGNRKHEQSHLARDIGGLAVGAAGMMQHNVEHPSDFYKNPFTVLNWLPIAGAATRGASVARLMRTLEPVAAADRAGEFGTIAKELGTDVGKHLPEQGHIFQHGRRHRVSQQDVADYENMHGNIIDTDLAREVSPNWHAASPTGKRALVHETKGEGKWASDLAKKAYTKALSKPPVHNRANIIVGAPGSGKSTISALEREHSDVIYETTGKSFESTASKIDEALATGRDVEIDFVVSDPAVAYYGTVARGINTGRPVPEEAFVKMTVASPRTIHEIAAHYAGNPHVRIEISKLDSERQVHPATMDDVKTPTRAEVEHAIRTVNTELSRRGIPGEASAEASALPAVNRPGEGARGVVPDRGGAEGEAGFTPVDHATFYEAMGRNPRQEFLTPHTPEDMQGATMFLSKDGHTGGAVKPDGEMVNIFRNPEGVPGSGDAALLEQIRLGGDHLEAFDMPALINKYKAVGMQEVARIKFVDEFAPDGWDYARLGRPDIVFMAKVEVPHLRNYMKGYDKAMAYAKEAAAAEKVKQGSKLGTAWKESRSPGYAAAHGWKGGIATKTRSGRAASRSSIGRGIQRGTDTLASRWTDFLMATRGKQSRFDQELRSGRVFEKTKSRRQQQRSSWLHRREAYIDRAVQGKPEREEALIAVLEAPRGLTFRQSVETKIKQLTQDGGERPSNINSQIEALHQALEGDFLESGSFKNAIHAAEEMSAYGDRQAARVLGMTKEELADRRNIISQDYADRGLLPEGIDTEARGYFPHRSIFEESKAPAGAPARPSGDVIGVPQLGKSFERRQNQLKRYFDGNVNRDPAVLSNTLRGRDLVMYKISIRRYLYNRGTPISEYGKIPSADSILIRNPDVKAKKIEPELKAAYQDPIKAMENDDPYIMRYEDYQNAKAAGNLEPEWAKDVDNLRVISPKLKNAVMADARNGTSSLALTMSVANALVRTVILHTPYGGVRYVTRNTVQNMLLMSLTHPSAFLALRKEVAYLLKHDKDMADRMQVEGGTIQAGMALPDKRTRVNDPQTYNSKMRNVQDTVVQGRDVRFKGRKVNLGLREYGRQLGWAADEPYRMAAWIRYAKEYGFKTRAQRRKLMFSEDPKLKAVRDNISQYVREDLIDFDTLSPFERNTVSQYLFIYPFVKGAAKWPLMYARDYPFRTGIMALIGAQADREGLAPPGMPRSEQELTTQNGTKQGWLVPYDPLFQDVQSGVALVNSLKEGKLDLSSVADFTAPQLRQLGLAGWGGGTTWDKLFKTFLPGYSTGKNIQKGGSVKDQFERMMGMKVEPSEFRIKERKKDWEKVKVDWQDSSGGYDSDLVTQGFTAKEGWKDLQQRAKYAGLDTGKPISKKDSLRLLNWYAHQVQPDGDWYEDSELTGLKDETIIKDAYNWMEGELWGELDRMRASASRNRSAG